MMGEVEFRREMNRNYMVLKPGPGKNEEYTVRMLTENRIPGFLPFREKQVDGERWFYYDVTSRQPLGRILEHRNLRGKELERAGGRSFIFSEADREIPFRRKIHGSDPGNDLCGSRFLPMLVLPGTWGQMGFFPGIP